MEVSVFSGVRLRNIFRGRLVQEKENVIWGPHSKSRWEPSVILHLSTDRECILGDFEKRKKGHVEGKKKNRCE